MGETIDAIGYKTDVRGRAEDYVSEKKNKVTGTVSGVEDRVASTASRVVPSREGIRHRSQRVFASTPRESLQGLPARAGPKQEPLTWSARSHLPAPKRAAAVLGLPG